MLFRSAHVFGIVSDLRDEGVAADCDHQGRSLKAQFKQADRVGARLVVVVGPEEIESGQVTVRDMGTKEERRVPLSGIAADARTLLDKQ